MKRVDEPAGAAIRQQLQTGRVGLLFGSEKTGLSSKDFSHCHWLLNIPTKEQNFSMNLGQAVAVCLYELARNTSPPLTTRDFEPPTAGQNEQITECLLDSLRMSGYVKPGTDAMFEKKARSLILHFNLEAYDAKLLLGMVRQIVWKLRRRRRSSRRGCREGVPPRIPSLYEFVTRSGSTCVDDLRKRNFSSHVLGAGCPSTA